MRERNLTFKQAVNAAIRAGAPGKATVQAASFRTFRMGRPRVPLDKALQLAGELEDEELIRKLALGK